MEGTVREHMTTRVITLDVHAPVTEAARLMRDEDIGDVLICEGKQIRGIITDRDITVRAVADGTDIAGREVSELCTGDPQTIEPDTTVNEALELMEQLAVRRLPVVEKGKCIGIVSLGDLSKTTDAGEAGEALADISDAPANN